MKKSVILSGWSLAGGSVASAVSLWKLPMSSGAMASGSNLGVRGSIVLTLANCVLDIGQFVIGLLRIVGSRLFYRGGLGGLRGGSGVCKVTLLHLSPDLVYRVSVRRQFLKRQNEYIRDFAKLRVALDFASRVLALGGYSGIVVSRVVSVNGSEHSRVVRVVLND